MRRAAWFAIAAVVAIIVPTMLFGSRFLLQFFVSPFQFFIIAPWALAVFAITTGTMPLKSGGRIEQAKAPAEYRRAVLFCVTAGAFGFVLDWIVSWMVVSRA